MGAPLDDAPRLHEWSNLIQRQFDPHSLMNEREAIERACEEFYEWAAALIERRRDDPGEDLISTLIQASHDGDRLDDAECMNLVLNVLVGGVDTTQSQLAHGLRVFAGHPDQWELLAEQPELAPAAVEELLRYEPITPFTARILHEDLEYRGVEFKADDIVMVCSFAGNRDGVDGDSEAFDITADRGAAKPLTFGAGIHYCLGANLARAELQEALAFLPERMPGLALDGEAELGSIHGIYGLERLPLRWN
jgi:cytochrome P450